MLLQPIREPGFPAFSVWTGGGDDADEEERGAGALQEGCLQGAPVVSQSQNSGRGGGRGGSLELHDTPTRREGELTEASCVFTWKMDDDIFRWWFLMQNLFWVWDKNIHGCVFNIHATFFTVSQTVLSFKKCTADVTKLIQNHHTSVSTAQNRVLKHFSIVNQVPPEIIIFFITTSKDKWLDGSKIFLKATFDLKWFDWLHAHVSWYQGYDQKANGFIMLAGHRTEHSKTRGLYLYRWILKVRKRRKMKKRRDLGRKEGKRKRLGEGRKSWARSPEETQQESGKREREGVTETRRKQGFSLLKIYLSLFYSACWKTLSGSHLLE